MPAAVTTASHVDLRAELKYVARRFEDFVERLRGRSRTVPADPGIRADNIALALPYYLVEALPFEGDRDAARSMAVGNAFGAAHFLVQDRLLDGDEALSPRALELSDRFLAEFLAEYARLPGLGGDFRQDLDRYLREYFESLVWEAEVLRAPAGIEAVSDEALPQTLRRLGRRMAPLKITGAAAASLSGRRDALSEVERFVDSFHAGYQLADDVRDLADDLGHARWSVVAWIIAAAEGRTEPPAPADLPRALGVPEVVRAFESTVDLIAVEYERALDAARSLGSPSLVGYMERLVERASREHERLLRRVTLSAGAAAVPGPAVEPARLEGVHAFSVGDRGYVYDVGSGLFFEADPVAMSLISWLDAGAEPVDLRVLEMNHGAERIRDALSEITLLRGAVDAGGTRFPAAWADAGLPGVSSIALLLTEQCNLRCDYCYHGGGGRAAARMSEETVVRAIDFLFEESVGERNVAVVFFGGEPLLCPDLMERAVEHARVVAARTRRRVSFHVTTNGTLLVPELALRLADMGVRILVSIDGTAADHDRHRVFADGSGSYDAIEERLSSLPPGTEVGARATVTPESGHLCDIVSHLSGLGFRVVHLAPVSSGGMSPGFSARLRAEFEELAREELRRTLAGGRPVVGNLVDALATLDAGRARLLPCGAGTRYLSVGANGMLYLCHRFAGDTSYVVGSVESGVDREKVGLVLAGLHERARGCASCWARWLCGGPCFYDLDRSAASSSGPGAPRCALRTRILELSMWLYASLPPPHRERAIGGADGRLGSERGRRLGASDAPTTVRRASRVRHVLDTDGE